jgi:hypothetical protein
VRELLTHCARHSSQGRAGSQQGKEEEEEWTPTEGPTEGVSEAAARDVRCTQAAHAATGRWECFAGGDYDGGFAGASSGAFDDVFADLFDGEYDGGYNDDCDDGGGGNGDGGLRYTEDPAQQAVHTGDQVSIHRADRSTAGYGVVREITRDQDHGETGALLSVEITRQSFTSDSGRQCPVGGMFTSGLGTFLPVPKLVYSHDPARKEVGTGDRVSVHRCDGRLAGYGVVREVDAHERLLAVVVDFPFVSDSGRQYGLGATFISGIDMFLPVPVVSTIVEDY